MKEQSYRNSPGYQNLADDNQRMYVSQHLAHFEDARSVIVRPAKRITVGKTSLEGSPGFFHPSITIFALQGAEALCFLANADELEALGNHFLKSAAEMRASAAETARTATNKARGDERR